MPISRDILGMNARNFLYIRKYNRTHAKRIADSKLATKQLLLHERIATPRLLAVFHTRKQINKFDWKLPSEGFVIKPARGYGGGGILPIKKWVDKNATSVVGEAFNIKQLQSNLLDILEGVYSLQFLPDDAYIEEIITPDPFFKKLAPVGIPDIRIIIFNYIPVMAMIRLPTKESSGKANLHQGALAVGIDLRTGITTYGIQHNKLITTIPDTKMKVRGIKIPKWDELLLLASRTQAIIGLGYAGIDIVFDAKRGPIILEVNARPGLSIQIANQTSLRTRLERVENMSITTPERGVEVAKSLFSEAFSEKVAIAPKILTVIQPVTITNNNKMLEIKAKLDTGAFRTSIDEKLADSIDLTVSKEKIFVKSASGQAYRYTVPLSFTLAGKKIKTIATIVDRSHLQYPMIVGRQDLKGFLIKPSLTEEQGKDNDRDDEK